MRLDKKERKKILEPNSVHTRLRQENFEKNREKIQKLKNLFQAIFFAKTGRERLRKSEKNVIPEFRSYLTRARKF